MGFMIHFTIIIEKRIVIMITKVFAIVPSRLKLMKIATRFRITTCERKIGYDNSAKKRSEFFIVSDIKNNIGSDRVKIP